MALAPKMDLPQTLDLPIPKLITREYILEPEFTNVKPEVFKLGSTAEYYKTMITEIVDTTKHNVQNVVQDVVQEVVPTAVEDFKHEISDKITTEVKNLKSLTLEDLTLMHKKVTEELKVRVPETVEKTIKKFCCFSY